MSRSITSDKGRLYKTVQYIAMGSDVMRNEYEERVAI